MRNSHPTKHEHVYVSHVAFCMYSPEVFSALSLRTPLPGLEDELRQLPATASSSCTDRSIEAEYVRLEATLQAEQSTGLTHAKCPFCHSHPKKELPFKLASLKPKPTTSAYKQFML